MMKVKGNDIIVFFQHENVWKTLAYGLTCELDITAETINVANSCSGKWVKKKKKRLGWSGSSAHLLSDEISDVDVMQLITSASEIRLMVGSVEAHPDAIKTSEYKLNGRLSLVGNALVTRLTISASKGTSCSLSLEFEGSGELEWRRYKDVIMQENKKLIDSDLKSIKVK